jgi:hypothetical protein
MDTFALEAGEEILRDGVVIGVALNARNLSTQKKPIQ